MFLAILDIMIVFRFFYGQAWGAWRCFSAGILMCNSLDIFVKEAAVTFLFLTDKRGMRGLFSDTFYLILDSHQNSFKI